MRIKFYYILLFTTSFFAQSIQTTIDKKQNKIGAEFVLSLKLNATKTDKVQFPNAKNLGALEVINSYPIDTVKNNDKLQLIKKYGVTQFDSGRYVIPKLPVFINKNIFYSDSLSVLVSNVKVDTLKQKMFDIKPILEAKKPASEWWKYLLYLLIFCTLAFGIWHFYNKNKKPIVKPIVYNSPIEKATSLLGLLEKKSLLEKGEIKEYYSELTDIARDYIEEAIQIPAKESTTAELIFALKAASKNKKMKLLPETLFALENVLKQADLVKFAKVKPLEYEIADDRQKIEKTILILDKAIPVTVNDNSIKAEILKNEIKLKAEKKKKITAIIAIFVGLIVFSLTYVGVTKGINFIKNGFSGYSTKELYNGNWIKSEYGNPSIVIETPSVLERLDGKKILPKETFAIIKDMQLFGNGSLFDNFYVLVSTASFKKETNVDLNLALEGTVKTLEAQGCQNMIVKQEEFTTEQGVKGIKGYGTFSQSKQKMAYQIILFSQQGGLQQVMFVHEENDDFGLKICERMLNSVQIQINQENK